MQMGCAGLFEETKRPSGDIHKPRVAKPEPSAPAPPKVQTNIIPPHRQAVIQPERPISPPPPDFEMSPPKYASPAIAALMADARNSSEAGNLDAAAVTVERALRIEPRNAYLFYELAELRLKQEKPRLAEELARKSVLLSAKDTQLKKQGWLLIAQARQTQGDEQGAAAARTKAAALDVE